MDYGYVDDAHDSHRCEFAAVDVAAPASARARVLLAALEKVGWSRGWREGTARRWRVEGVGKRGDGERRGGGGPGSCACMLLAALEEAA
eukprot:13063-Chlamydomonas_euryale.AAC.1